MCDPLDFVTPAYVGMMDYDEGLECDPTRHSYMKVTDCEAYIASYKDKAQMDDTLEYEEDMLDREHHMRGLW